MNKPLIIAMDFKDRTAAESFLDSFTGTPLFLKVGMELFYQEGPSLVEAWKEKGHRIFLDLKLHDIPSTVQSAARQLAALNVDLITVHAAGGIRMMEAAREGLETGTPAADSVPDCVAVTQLTSTTEKMMQEELGIPAGLEETVIHYAVNAKQAGLQGIVCSALEAPAIKEHAGRNMKAVTPGIRMKEQDRNDQKRVVTPAKARNLGSDAIVVGRSITSAEQPWQTYQDMMKQWRGKQ
ncbi:orotidine-5'-phosphate decarboxylase [Salibacterium aidingense]|uniref:orotidine-5'-phosphate decarboxylase n=1 Tax=Salibacterium aidingense TaxID=384933 RepID=UPI0003FDFF82|nr:orotidine-5'-phosphate decarboxylase [Salibacterium aidingense]